MRKYRRIRRGGGVKAPKFIQLLGDVVYCGNGNGVRCYFTFNFAGLGTVFQVKLFEKCELCLSPGTQPRVPHFFLTSLKSNKEKQITYNLTF